MNITLKLKDLTLYKDRLRKHIRDAEIDSITIPDPVLAKCRARDALTLKEHLRLVSEDAC